MNPALFGELILLARVEIQLIAVRYGASILEIPSFEFKHNSSVSIGLTIAINEN